MSASYDAYHEGKPRRDPQVMLDYVKANGCPKCGEKGSDRSKCKRYCPIPGSPEFNEVAFKEEYVKARLR